MGCCMISIDPCVCFVWALLLLVLPLRWMMAAVGAALVHELGHYLCLRIVAGKPTGLYVGISGIKMNVAGLSYGQELLCTASGPAASFCLLLIGKFFPLLGFCGLVQGLYNLLPIYPMDGGRILNALLCLWLPLQQAERILIWIRWIFFGLFAAVLMALRLYSGLILLVAMSFPGGLRGKIPCKPTQLGLQ